MSTEDKSQRPDLDLGLSPDEIRGLVKQIGERGYGKLEVKADDVDTASKWGREFVFFIQEVLPKIGVKYDEVKKPLLLDMDPNKDDIDEVLKRIWNKRAKAWGWVETPVNYQATFGTLISFMETSPKPKKERIVSLGSGPGLYESFFMYLYSKLKLPSKLEMYCVDFSSEMTAINNRIIKSYKGEGGRMISGVKPVTGDMTNLDFPDSFFDQIICNNSLQWAPDWKKAILEMARVINPEGLGNVYISINRNPMRVIDEQTNKTLLSLGDISPTELLDTLEANKFQIINTRQFISAKGLGQMGGHSDRMFIKAKYIKDGDIQSWRNVEVKAATHFFGANSK